MSLAKKQKRGILLPPAVGYSLKIMAGLFTGNHISAKYYPRLVIITLIPSKMIRFLSSGTGEVALLTFITCFVRIKGSGLLPPTKVFFLIRCLPGWVGLFLAVSPDCSSRAPAKVTMLSWIPQIRRKKNLHLATKHPFAFTISGCSLKISEIITTVSSGFGEFRIYSFNPGKTITNY